MSTTEESPRDYLERFWADRRKPVRNPGSWIYIYEDLTGPEPVYSFDMEDSTGQPLCTGDLTQGYDSAQFTEQVARAHCILDEPVYVSMSTISPPEVPVERKSIMHSAPSMYGSKVVGARAMRMHMEIDQHDDR